MTGALFLFGFLLLVFGTYIPDLFGPGHGAFMNVTVFTGIGLMAISIFIEIMDRSKK